MSFKLGEHLPAALYKTFATTTWGGTANTCTITDPKISTNSMIIVQVTGATPATGRWSYTYSQGSVAISSSDSESSTLALAYIIL